MIIKYADGTQSWNLKEVKILASEAESVENVTGVKWGQVLGEITSGSITALRSVTWVLLKRETPTLRYRDFDPAADDMDVEFDAEERKAMREEIQKSPDLTEAEKSQAMIMLADPEEVDAPKE